MEFSRRNFIKFAAGGLGGTLLSPLPWKLIDDIAIWTQNWSWVPVPERGKFSYINTVCTLCPGAAVCPLGMAGLQVLYNEGIRWKAPMKRVGPRGSQEWKEISWDEATDTLANRIKGLRDKGNPEKLAAVDGNQSRSTMALLIKRLLSSIGSPNYLRMPREEDTYSMVNFLMQGINGPLAFDLENADFILSFGCGLLDGWGSPGRMLSVWRHWVTNEQQHKTQIAQVEPRASNTASKADIWLAPFPGTEAALALGMAHVIIKEKLYNKEFIKNHSFGFYDWFDDKGAEHKGFSSIVLGKYSPKNVENITGIKRSIIIEVARKFASAHAPIALAGRGKGTFPGSLYEFMSIHALNALAGRVNNKGGTLITDDVPLAPWVDVEYDSVANNGLTKGRLDRAGTLQYPFTESLMHKFTEVINGSHSSPVDTLLLCSTNPVHTMSDNKSFIEALAKIPFIVSFSPFMDETSMMADLILPDHSHLEKMVDIVKPTGLQYPCYALSQPVVKPLYRTSHSGDVIISLAKRIGGTVAHSFQWANFEEALKERVSGLYDAGKNKLSWEDVTKNGYWYIPRQSLSKRSDIFKTPSKKFEFFSTEIELALKAYSRGKSFDDALLDLGISTKGDEACMPHYEEIKSHGDENKYPLLLLPVEFINLATGWIGNPPFLNKTLFDHQIKRSDLFVEVNPKTASRYGLTEGSRAMLQSPKGELSVRIHLFDGAMPGVIFIPFGLGHTAYDKYLKGKGVNPNEIIDPIEDPLSGQPVWWNTRVKVIKV
ncbi:MAG: molybdopterin-dependent oxidoreductase [Deltaproteobacteria bacterium]|nr:molybdopterin-dependent oxidoreductase [Deltaproteobacteria bacterium]